MKKKLYFYVPITVISSKVPYLKYRFLPTFEFMKEWPDEIDYKYWSTKKHDAMELIRNDYHEYNYKCKAIALYLETQEKIPNSEDLLRKIEFKRIIQIIK